MTKIKKNSIITFTTILLISSAIFLYHQFSSRASGYSWFQTDWAGGASTTAVATHVDNQTGWDKFYSKDDNVVASSSGQLSLSTTTDSLVNTSDEDFASGTLSNIYVGSGAVKLKKPEGVTCSASSECLGNFCSNGVCSECSSFTYDSITYPVVVIGTQCWMAANLNVGVYVASTGDGSNVSNNSIIEKYCYDNTESNCTTYGGLYDWSEMMGYVTTAGTQGICPSSWHLPTDAEWYTLENYLKDNGQTCNSGRSGQYDCTSAGTKLKNNGTSGFNGLLAGDRFDNNTFGYLDQNGTFWSSSENGSGAWYRNLELNFTSVSRFNLNKDSGFSVRCLKN